MDKIRHFWVTKIELRDRSHLCYKSIINDDLDIMNILVISPQIRYIKVFDITNPPFNEQIWPVPSNFIKSRFHCTWSLTEMLQSNLYITATLGTRGTGRLIQVAA